MTFGIWEDDITIRELGGAVAQLSPSKKFALAVFESAVTDFGKYRVTSYPDVVATSTRPYVRDREAEWWRNAYVWLTSPDKGPADHCSICSKDPHDVLSLAWVAGVLEIEQDVLIELTERTVDRWVGDGDLGPVNIETVKLIREQRRTEANGEIWNGEELRDRGEIWVRRQCSAGAAELVRAPWRKPRRS